MSEEAIATAGEVATETPGEETATATHEVENAEPVTDTTEPKKGHELPRNVQRRIDRITRARYEAEAKVKMLEERIQATEQGSKPQQPTGAPKIEDFQDFDTYLTAKAEWIADQRLMKAQEEWGKKSQAEREYQESANTVESWNKRLGKATTEIPDLTEVLEASDAPMPPHVGRAIMDSDMGPQVAYWLAKNPEEAERIAELSPLAAVKAIGRIEEKIEAGALKAKKPTSAPPPINPSGNKSAATADPEKMSVKEWMEWRKKKLAT